MGTNEGGRCKAAGRGALQHTELHAAQKGLPLGHSSQPGATLLELQSFKENRNSLIFRKVTTTPAFF